ncbi:hypothetical protein [Psychroserpens damuponensis]|uniref:hypothetical protein n=1 Tax=Psychroserpens damuponensis TaxID=943936 RepID=UPI00058E8D0A|nr:hypothetical protein [Psychroserpens damuponensis]
MKIVLLLTLLLTSNFGFCQETEKLTVERLKLELAEFLLEKKSIKSIDQHINFYGIHKNKIDEKLKNGIYVFNNASSHNRSFFVIVEDNSFSILDISTLQGLKDSIAKTLEFANKQKYCTEIIQDYISRLVNVHFRVNRNPTSQLNKNCEFELKPTKSTYELKSLRLKLAEFLVKQNEIENIEYYYEYDLFLMVRTFEIYYGIDKKENIDCGVYSFEFLNEEYDQNRYYVIVNEDWLEIFEIESSGSLSDGINKILDFAESHKYCHLKTGQIIEQLIGKKYSESCFDNPTFELP